MDWLSPVQEREWEFMSGLSPSNPGLARYVVVANRLLEGIIHENALVNAFADVATRHDVLRMKFENLDPDPRVHIVRNVHLPVEFMDLSIGKWHAKWTVLEDLVFRERRRAFDLLNGPIWHAWVIRLDEMKYVLTITFSHVIADGWSANVFVTDLLTAYAARVGGLTPNWPDAPSFAELSAIHAARLGPTQQKLEFWKQSLDRLPGSSFPVCLEPLSSIERLANTEIGFALGRRISMKVRKLAWRARTTPFVGMMAAYHLTFALELQRDWSVVQTTISDGRTERERESILLSSSEIYLSVQLPNQYSMVDAVRATHIAMVGARKHLVSYTDLARTINAGYEFQRPWSDAYIRDGDISSEARYVGPRLKDGLNLVARGLYIYGRSSGSVRVDGEDARKPLSRPWRARCSPKLVINYYRNGGVMRFNALAHSHRSVRNLLGKYLWTLGALVEDPYMTVAQLRELHARRTSTADGSELMAGINDGTPEDL